MPITDDEGCRSVVFGEGDIQISLGLTSGLPCENQVIFTPRGALGEPEEIEGAWKGLDEMAGGVRLVFLSSATVDWLVSRLRDLGARMGRAEAEVN